MKKGLTATTFVVIVLGLLVILIILGAFGGPLKKASEGAISKVKSAMGIEEKAGAIVPGTVLGAGSLPKVHITNAQHLAEEVVKCWKLFQRKNTDTPCVTAVTDQLNGEITEDDFDAALAKADPPLGADLAGEGSGSGAENYSWELGGKLKKGDAEFIICADDDGTDEVFLTRDADDCD